MPTYPVYELLSQNIVTVLKQLVTTPGTGGTRLSAVERWKLKPANVPANLKAVLYGGDDEIQPDDETPIDDNAWRRPYSVLVYVFDNEQSTTPYEQRVNIVRADVETIMLSEIKNGTNFGGNCWNCLPVGAHFDMEAKDVPFIEIFFDLFLWTDQFNPYTAG